MYKNKGGIPFTCIEKKSNSKGNRFSDSLPFLPLFYATTYMLN